MLSLCALEHAFRDDDPPFVINSKALSAEDINIQAIIRGSHVV
jgi:hypothetical protein